MFFSLALINFNTFSSIDTKSDTTTAFLGYVSSLIDQKVLGEDDLLFLRESAQEGVAANPISDLRAQTSVCDCLGHAVFDKLLKHNVDHSQITPWVWERISEEAVKKIKRKDIELDTKKLLTPQVQPLFVAKNQACAIGADGIACWDMRDFELNQTPEDLDPIIAIAGGDDHVCALQANGIVVCWQNNKPYQISLHENLGQVAMITAGQSHTCALKADGTIACWGGNNSHGENNPPHDLGLVIMIAAGGNHTCAVKICGSVVCWGVNSPYGQSEVPKDLRSVVMVAAGFRHTCALHADGTVACWGAWHQGQARLPEDLGSVVMIAAGHKHSCGVKTDGSFVCWGGYFDVQDGPPENLGPVSMIAVGFEHACGVKVDGTVVCWNEDYEQKSPVKGLRITLPILRANL